LCDAWGHIVLIRAMDSVKDSAKPADKNDRGEDTVLGTADGSKAQGPMVGPSKQKRKRSKEPAEKDVDGNPSKKRRGGRKPYENSMEFMSHDRYKTVSGETSRQKRKRIQKIRRY
jgi:hypothetical protein